MLICTLISVFRQASALEREGVGLGMGTGEGGAGGAGWMEETVAGTRAAVVEGRRHGR